MIIVCLNNLVFCSHLLTHTQVCHSQKNQRSSTSASTLKHYGRRMKLYCRHGYNILVFPNGTVSSSDDDKDSHCIMEFTSMSPGHVRIKGVEANLFLAMNKNGLLYGEVLILLTLGYFLKIINHVIFSRIQQKVLLFSLNNQEGLTAHICLININVKTGT